MHPEEYERMYRYEGEYWWFVGRRELILTLVQDWLGEHSNGLFLEAGCGTGAMLKTLEQWGLVIGVDLATPALEFCRRRGCAYLVQASVERLPFPEETFDLITALDLLEHVEDDQGALSEFYRVLKPGGLLALTVPAYRFLWSGHDIALHHKRRYTASLLRSRLKQAKFTIRKLSYAVTLLFLPILLFRLQNRWFQRQQTPHASIVPVPSWLNRLLIALQRFEAHLVRLLNLPFGVSLVAIVSKETPSTSIAEKLPDPQKASPDS
ncbi:MAG: class I SAM-dependent methyltransferase [candidate division WOR-3 bacterium]